MSDPFDLDEIAAYRAWRARRLADWPASAVALRVQVARLAERERLTRLLSQPSVYMFRRKLKPDVGYTSNNVLHNRSGFTDPTESG